MVITVDAAKDSELIGLWSGLYVCTCCPAMLGAGVSSGPAVTQWWSKNVVIKFFSRPNQPVCIYFYYLQLVVFFPVLIFFFNFIYFSKITIILILFPPQGNMELPPFLLGLLFSKITTLGFILSNQPYNTGIPLGRSAGPAPMRP